MVNFINADTTLSKAVKTLLWTGLSAMFVAVLSLVAGKPEMFSPTMVLLANVGLVVIKNVADPKVKNF